MISQQMNTNGHPPMVISYQQFIAPVRRSGRMRREEKLALNWCEKNGLRLTDQLAERGITAQHRRKGINCGLAAFFELVLTGTIPSGSVLLIESLKRISREPPEDTVALLIDIAHAGVSIVTLETGVVLRRGQIDQPRLLRIFMSLLYADEYAQKRSERQRAAADVGGASRSGSSAAASSDDKGQKLDPSKAVVVRTVFELAQQGLSLDEIMRQIDVQ